MQGGRKIINTIKQEQGLAGKMGIMAFHVESHELSSCAYLRKSREEWKSRQREPWCGDPEAAEGSTGGCTVQRAEEQEGRRERRLPGPQALGWGCGEDFEL